MCAGSPVSTGDPANHQVQSGPGLTKVCVCVNVLLARLQDKPLEDKVESSSSPIITTNRGFGRAHSFTLEDSTVQVGGVDRTGWSVWLGGGARLSPAAGHLMTVSRFAMSPG